MQIRLKIKENIKPSLMCCFIINVKVTVVLLWEKTQIEENFYLDEIEPGVILTLYLNLAILSLNILIDNILIKKIVYSKTVPSRRIKLTLFC